MGHYRGATETTLTNHQPLISCCIFTKHSIFMHHISKLWHVASLLLLLFITTACQETLEERAAREARQFTAKSCPMRLDEFTRLDSMTFTPAADIKSHHTLNYWYTLTGNADHDYSADELRQAKEMLSQSLANSTNLTPYREAGYRFRYIYRSSSDMHLTRCDFMLE